MKNVYFFEIEKILDSSNIFEELKKRQIFFSYFQVDQKYYILVFAEKSFDPDFLYKLLTGIRELNYKQRRIRSLRGFLTYALEIRSKGINSRILETNLKPYFWREIGNVIRQNRQEILLKFLFSNSSTSSVEDLQNQINFLQEKIFDLEKKLESRKIQ